MILQISINDNQKENQQRSRLISILRVLDLKLEDSNLVDLYFIHGFLVLCIYDRRVREPLPLDSYLLLQSSCVKWFLSQDMISGGMKGKRKESHQLRIWFILLKEGFDIVIHIYKYMHIHIYIYTNAISLHLDSAFIEFNAFENVS